ncbi:MAG: tRNA (adenosine(37)-N6)-threonylcarbamoyltransferase complex dimerization subunit type 1 TsaB [Verrucomicrobia bacterium]|nr:tRNA (adenosine(37)-N6)-threonylcarbamoyltransferase complex dimerization subunit type 1 TsaB [Verrucomicrobiota bacterium]
MRILALEFSSPRRSAAVVDAPPGRSPVVLGEAAEHHASHTRAFALIDRALDAAGLPRDRVDCLAVGLGPGSYTGIRIAIAIAQGWRLARSVRLLGIPTPDCLAQQAHAAGFRGRAHFLIDAQHHEFYLATTHLHQAGPGPLSALRLATLDELRALCRTEDLLFGYDVQHAFPHTQSLFPHAAACARLAIAWSNAVHTDPLEPLTLKTPAFVKAPPPRTDP